MFNGEINVTRKLNFQDTSVKVLILANTLADKNQGWQLHIYFCYTLIYFINMFTLMTTRTNKLTR